MDSYMTVKGQIVIPSKIRRKFGIKQGTRVQVEVNEQAHRIILTPVTADYIQKLRGKYKGKRLLTALAYLGDEASAQEVADLITHAHENRIPMVMSAVNAGEVWYILAREISEAQADSAVTDLTGLGIELIGVDWPLTRLAGTFKARHKMSYADCFAAALAKHRKSDLVTGDKEFKRIEGEVSIRWL